MKINNQPPATPPGGGPAAVRGRPVPSAGSGSTPAGSASPGPVIAPATKVELSARSRELHEALKAANDAPDVREDAVAAARARIAKGTYRVDSERIARGILDKKA